MESRTDFFKTSDIPTYMLDVITNESMKKLVTLGQ